jgi:hypothetical protein
MALLPCVVIYAAIPNVTRIATNTAWEITRFGDNVPDESCMQRHGDG